MISINAIRAAMVIFLMPLSASAGKDSPDVPDANAKAAVPQAVTVARATRIPACTIHVDAAAPSVGSGTAASPYRSLDNAVGKAGEAAVICVAEGVYPVALLAGTKAFTLAGGFQSGQLFKIRDSAIYVSKARGKRGSFVKIVDPGPTGKQLTVVDGFEITGYSQAILRDFYLSQRMDITNNYIHDNSCSDASLTGAGFALNNVTGSIRGNVFERNFCGRGGAGALNDSTNSNRMTISGNLVRDNRGTEPESAHGGGFYLFAHKLVISGNRFDGNRVTGWGGGLYVGANTGGGQSTTATLNWNVYLGNRAGNTGGGLFCDDSALCVADHEILAGNCGGNLYLDGGPGGAGPTIARFDHMTNVGARDVSCKAAGQGVQIDKDNLAADKYSFTNSIFSGNAPGLDFSTSCGVGCGKSKIDVRFSMVQRKFFNGGVGISFGPGIVKPVDPRFADGAGNDFHLQSRFGHWTPSGMIADAVSCPLLAKGDPAGKTNSNPPRAGTRTELGAYGNSAQASFVK